MLLSEWPLHYNVPARRVHVRCCGLGELAAFDDDGAKLGLAVQGDG